MKLIQKRLLNLGEIFTATTEILTARIKEFAVMNIIYLLAIFIFSLIMGAVIVSSVGVDYLHLVFIKSDPAVMQARGAGAFAIVMLVFFLWALGSGYIGGAAMAANIRIADSYLKREELSIPDTFKASFSDAVRIYAVTFIIGIIAAVIIGIIGLIIILPAALIAKELAILAVILLYFIIVIAGIGVMVYLSFLSTAAVLRNKWISSIQYSYSLVKGYYWLTLGYFAVLWILLGIINMTVSFFGQYYLGTKLQFSQDPVSIGIYLALYFLLTFAAGLLINIIYSSYKTVLFINRENILINKTHEQTEPETFAQ
ncbi:hypothetical protein Dip518_000022 [Parelusimicrobium proximum]|uniref:hypothetical protein n=1 Tax=Parelusimicrobium proximum TaxID=3228953 RepID=UPI003D182834